MSDIFNKLGQSANLYESLTAASSDKRIDLIQQFNEKMAGIEALTQLVAAEEEANKNAWVNKLGLDRHSMVGQAVNAAAGFTSGVANIWSNLVNTPAALDVALTGAAIPDEVKQAYSRVLRDKATPDDMALLNQPLPGQSPAIEAMGRKPRTWGSEIARWQEAQQGIEKRSNALDISSIVDKRAVTRLQEDLANDARQASALYDQGDYLGAASTLIGGIFKAGGKNPDAVFQLIAETAPDLILTAAGPFGLAASGVSYATDIFTDAVAEYRRQNRGALPSQEWILKNAALAASAAAGDALSDKLTLGAGKAVKGVVDAVRKASQDAAASTFKRAVLGTAAGAVDNLPVRTALGGAIGATGEYGTEMYQTWVENTTKGKDSSFEDLHVGGAMGALAAGPISTTAAFRDELVRSLAKNQDDAAITPAARELIQKAVETKDLSALLDQNSPTYNPSHAVAALYGLTQREDITEDERTQYVQQASQLLQQMEDRLDALRQNTPEGRQETQQFLQQEQQRLAQMQQQGASEADLADQQELINVLQEELQAPLPKGKAAEQLQRDIRKLSKQIERSRLLVTDLGQRQANATVQAVAQDPQAVEQLVSQANTDVSANPNRQATPEVQQAIDELINLSMVAPDSTSIISPEQAKALADNPNNALTEDQRTYLRTLSDARVAINALQTLEGVERDILEGNTQTGMKGLMQYQREMAALIKTGDMRGMRRLLTQLGNFATSHTGKAAALSSALAEAQSEGLKRGSGIQIVKQGDSWVRATKRYSDARLRRLGGYEIHAGSESLVQAAQAEAAAIESTLQNLQSVQKLAMQRTASVRPTAVKTVTTPTAPVATTTPTAPVATTATTATTAPTATTATTAPTAPAGVPAEGAAAVEAAGTAGAPGSDAGNGFKHGPQKDERYRVGVSSATGGVTLEKRLPGGTAATFYVGKDGNFIDAGTVSLNSEQSRSKLWVPADEAQKQEALSILDEMGKLELNDPKRDALKNRLKSLVTGEKEAVTVEAAPVAEQPKAPQATAGEGQAATDGSARPAPAAAAVQADGVEGAPVQVFTGKSALFDGYGASIGNITEGNRRQLMVDPGGGYFWGDWRQEAQRDVGAVAGGADKDAIPATFATSKEAKAAAAATPVTKTAPTAPAQSATDSATQDVNLQNRDRSRAAPTVTSAAEPQTTEVKATSVEEKSISEQASLKEVVPELVQDETNTTSGESASEDATLNALKEKSTEGTPYTRRNLIADYFSQVKHATKPLTQVKNFLSKWKAGEVQVKDFLPEGMDLSGNTLTTFIRVAEILRPVFLKQPKPKTNPDQRYEDPVQFLMEIDPKTNRATLEENLTTAMTAAVFGWVADAAAKGQFMTKETLAAVLGLEESALSRTPYQTIREFNGIVSTQNTAANALGRAALQALGLKANSNAKLDLQPRLESTLGMYILKALMDPQVGILERRSYTVEQLKQMDLPVEGKAKSKRHFVALKRKANGELTGLANTIRSSMSGSKSILAKLFDLQEEGALPSFEPIRNRQETTHKTRDKAPKWLKNILNKLSKQGYTVRQEMWDLITALDDLDPKYVLRMAGWEEVDVRTTHKSKRDSQMATNESIERDYTNALDYIRTVVEPSEQGLEQPIYFGHSIWRNQRVGMTGTVLNPQGSNLHRYLVGKVGWVSKIDPADPQSYDTFRLAVLAGLGKMTQKDFGFKVGNVPDALALSHFNRVVNAPKIAAAVDVLLKRLRGDDLTEADAETLVEGVQAGGEEMHTLDALMALAQEKMAQGKPFETRLTAEVDGVANGPMLSLAMLGVGGKRAFSMLNRGGFFEQGNVHKNYSTWRGEPGSQDLYEFMTARVYRVMQNLKLPPKTQEALDYFIGKIVDPDTGETTVIGRKWIKKPLTALFFGSTMTNAVNGMADEFVTGIYTAIEKVGPDGTDAQREELIKHINALLPKDVALDTRMTMAKLMEFEFTNQQYKALVKAFAESAGKGVEQVLKEEFQGFLSNRDTMNQAAEVAFNLYETLYQAARKHYASLVLPQDTGRTLHDLTAEQEAQVEAAVRRAFPILNTFASLQDKDPDAGISIRKTERSTAPDAAYDSLVEFGTPFADGSVTARTRGERLVGVSPGVAMVPFSAHSLDSGISHTAAANGEVLNIHDAHVVNAAGMQETARNLNRATFQALLEYGPAMEMQLSLLKTLQGTVQVLEKLPENHPIRQAMKAVPLPKGMSLADVIQNISAVALQTEQHRTDVLSNLQAVDQYAMEGGQYEVTDADRHAAREQGEKRQQTVQMREQQLIKLADQFNSLVFGQSETETNTPATPVADALKPFTSVQLAQALEHLAKTEGPQQANAKAVLAQMVLSPSVAAALDVVAEAERESLVQALIEQIGNENKNRWGEEGTPIAKSDPVLAKFLKSAKNGKTPAREALQFMLDQPGMLNRVQAFIAKMLDKTLPDDLDIVYVTPNTPESDVMAQAQADKSRGWFVARATGGAVINVLGDAYVYSMITPELLLHEMFHAAGARKVQKYLNQMKKYTNKKVPKELLEDPGYIATLELLKLLNVAKTYVETNNLQDRFGPAVANVHELISWGMTNQDFQLEVLAKVEMKSSLTQREEEQETVKQWMVNGLKVFIERLTALIFGTQEQPNASATARNGVAVLVGNVAILMKSIQQDIEANKANNATLNLSQQATTVDAWTTQEILAALTQDPSQTQPSPEFKAQLMERLDAIVNKLYGPFGLFKARALPRNNSVGVLASWKSQAWANGINPVTSRQGAANLVMSDAESFVIDQLGAVVSFALNNREPLTAVVYRELRTLYHEAKQRLTPEDFYTGTVPWGQASNADKAHAIELYNFLFRPEMISGTGQSDYLARFAAFGLGHETVAKALGFATKVRRADLKGKPLFQKIELLVQRLIDWINNKLTHTYEGQRADDKLNALIHTLVHQEHSRRFKTQYRLSRSADLLEAANEVVGKGFDKVKQGVAAVSSSRFIQHNPFALVRAAGTVGRIVATNRVDDVLDKISEMRNLTHKGLPGMLMGTLNYVRGPAKFAQALIRANKLRERNREETKSGVARATLAAFANNGENLTQEDKAAISAVALRSGMFYLLDAYSLADIEQMLADPKKLKAEIAQMEQRLKAYPREAGFYLAQARALAYYRARGRVTSPSLLLNASNIAHLFGTSRVNQVPGAQIAEVLPTLERLITLQVLAYSKQEHRQRVSQIMRSEAQRGGENGIEFVLKLHRALHQDAKERLFQGNETLMIHGYLPEITNQHISIEIARTPQDVQRLKDAGYTMQYTIPLDPRDPNRNTAVMFSLEEGGLPSRMTAALSITDNHAKGSRQFADFVDMSTPQGQLLAIQQRRDKDAMTQQATREADALFTTGASFDPDQVPHNFMAPIMNLDGQVSDWRYLMQEETKDGLLQRDNRFEHLLGSMAARTLDKVSTKEQNRKVAQALFEHFKSEFAFKPHNFVLVGPTSPDPAIRDLWNTLPKETQQDIYAIWGASTQGMYVPYELVDAVFGYRKYSLADAFDKQAFRVGQKGGRNTRTLGEEIYVTLAETFIPTRYRDRIKLYTRKAEIVWQEIVREIKDNIVVRSYTVLRDNIKSNLSLLLILGVPFKDLVKYHVVAIRGAIAYQNDSQRLAELRYRLQLGYGPDLDKVRDEIVELEDALARNPVRELMEEGLMSTIVEDVDFHDDPYSYRSKLVRWIDAKTEKVPELAKNIGRNFYMSRSTSIYRFLARSTQLSDFVARYALYQHLTTRDKNPLSKADAIQQASEAFVNYDIPLPRYLQYLDDMGFTMFIKYFLSIQRVLLRLFKERPGSMLISVALSNMFDGLDTVVESSALHRLGNNPFDMGAANYPFTLDELATVQATMSLMK